jgi:DNA-binding transcriptional regulator YiaG
MQIFGQASPLRHYRSEEVRMASKTKLVARKLNTGAGALTSAEPFSVGTVRGRLGLSRRMFSRLAGFSERAIADWESGKPVSESGLRRIKELDRFRERLSEVVDPDATPSWLGTPNKAFDGLKPIEVIERGEIDRLWNMIFYLESGVANYWAVNPRSMGWTAAVRRTGPAEAGTPTSLINIDKALDHVWGRAA